MSAFDDADRKIADPEKDDWNRVPTPPHQGELPLDMKQACSSTDLEKCTFKKTSESTENVSVLEEDSDDPNVVGWDSPTDPENPVNWSFRLRWGLITLVSAIAFMAGLSSSMFAPGIPALLVEFNVTNSLLGSLVVTIFVLGLASGPLIFGPASELYGRTYVQYAGCLGFLVFSIACAVSTSLNMLIGMRLFQGMFASCPFTNGGGLIADMIKQEERGFAMSMFTLGTIFGPMIGPVAGAFLCSAKGWRWVFWVISIMIGVLFALALIMWRESYAPVLLARKAARLRKETGNPLLRSKYDMGLSPQDHFKRGIFRPIKMLVFSPILLALCIHMGLGYAYFYLLFTTFTKIFTEDYGFSTKTVGLTFIGTGIGFFIGQATFAKMGDSILLKLAKKNGGEMKPEYRLPLACIGGLFIPIGFFWYGWSAQAKVHWIVPILGTVVIGFGNSLVFISIQAYTIDAFTLYAASGLAANAVVRAIMAFALPLAGPKLYETLGLGWGNSLLAFLALAIVPVPFFLFIYGERMREWNTARLKKL